MGRRGTLAQRLAARSITLEAAAYLDAEVDNLRSEFADDPVNASLRLSNLIAIAIRNGPALRRALSRAGIPV